MSTYSIFNLSYLPFWFRMQDLVLIEQAPDHRLSFTLHYKGVSGMPNVEELINGSSGVKIIQSIVKSS